MAAVYLMTVKALVTGWHCSITTGRSMTICLAGLQLLCFFHTVAAAKLSWFETVTLLPEQAEHNPDWKH